MGTSLGFIIVGSAGALAVVFLTAIARRGAAQVSLADAAVVAPTSVFERQRQRYGSGQCSREGCKNSVGWLCSYQAPTGDRCRQRWCKDHIEFVGKVPYCHRHAGVVRALAATAGTIKAVKVPPALDDRAVPLLTLIASDLDADFTELLRELYVGRPEVQVASRSGVQEVWVDGVRAAWQRTWGAYVPAGYLTRVYLRVGVAEPPVVQAVVGDDVVYESVPPWIARRQRGEPQQSGDRVAFRKAIVDAVVKRLEPIAEDLAVEELRRA